MKTFLSILVLVFTIINIIVYIKTKEKNQEVFHVCIAILLLIGGLILLQE